MKRALFTEHALHVAPRLLGSYVTVSSSEGAVTLRITEVEAYHGVGVPGPYDAGSHSRDRRTERNASMFGPPGHAYVYLNYGMHYALNLVCSPEGVASGVLVRSAEVVDGLRLAHARRETKRATYSRATAREGVPIRRVPDHHLARGPGNLATAVGVTRETHDGLDLFDQPFSISSGEIVADRVRSGPRVGVAGAAGGPEFPWRFWLTGEASVSAFRPGPGAPPARPPR